MDLRMTPYSCLATGNQVGIIEFVHNAKTVYNIQRQGNRLAAMQFDSSQLYKWIKEVSQKVNYIIIIKYSDSRIGLSYICKPHGLSCRL